MVRIYWKTASTQRDIDDAQRVRWECLIEDLGIPTVDGALVRRDVSVLDNLETVTHVLLYRGGTAIGTARLTRANAKVGSYTGSRFGFELERAFELDGLLDIADQLGEVSRLCIARPRRYGAARSLYEGLYVVSRQLDVRYWIGAVDCQTTHLDDAALMSAALTARGLASERFRLAERRVAHAPQASCGTERFYSPAELEAARRDGPRTLRLAPALEAFTRRLGARCIGAPMRHPVFPRYVLPMLVDLHQLPAATMATFDRSLVAPGLRSPAAQSSITGAEDEQRDEPRGDFYAELLEIARDAVRGLEGHPTGSMLIEGTLRRDMYVAYLTQVVHQVHGSAPMLERAAQALRGAGKQRLAALLCSKAREEDGHDKWAAADLEALGVSAEQIADAPRSAAVIAYGAWASHIVEATPVAVLGLAFVLEWFGHCRAGRAADNLVARACIPGIGAAVRFLRAHGEADQDHIRVLARAVAEIAATEDRDAILLSARVTARLYLSMLDWAGGDGARWAASAGRYLLGAPSSPATDATLAVA